MLPSTNWIPAQANDDRFPVLDSPLPQPLVAIYRDFSTVDPVTDIDDLDMNKIEVGPENHITSQFGRAEDLSKSLVVKLSQGNVYSALLADTLFVPAQSGVEFG